MTSRPANAASPPTAGLRRLGGFFGFLRRRGLTLGVGAEVDLGRALGHVDLLDPASVRDACRATLAKSPADLAIVDAAFEEYWFSHPSAGAEVETTPAPPALASPPRDGRSVRTPPSRLPPTAAPPRVAVRFGVYSPDAPPAGHPLRPIGPRQLAAFMAGARGFRRSSATLPGRRYEPSHRGRVDFRRTSRHAVGSAGEWLDLKRMRRKRLRAELVILWDVSGSMGEHDDQLAALVYALHRTVRRSRVFAFSTDLQEVTGHLSANPYPRALAAISRSLGPAGGGTRLGRCLADFRRRHGEIVHTRTTVLVLSDGWDLGGSEGVADGVRWLHGRAHLVAWVNPYARAPGFRPITEAMREALPYIDLLVAPSDFERAGQFPPPGLRSIGSAGRVSATVANG